MESSDYSQMPDAAPIDWLKTFADLDVTLTALELDAINAACENMSQPIVGDRGHPADWPHTAFWSLENKSKVGDDGAAVALDPDAFQIIRYHDHTKDLPWLRFGLQLRSRASEILCRRFTPVGGRRSGS